MLTYERLKTRATEFLALTGLTVKEFDAYINLTEMGTRWYDADLGRRISPDFIVPQPGKRQAFNHYSYLAKALIGFQGGSQRRARKLDGRYDDIIMALHFDP